MPFRNRWLVISTFLLVLALAIVFMPFAISSGIRLWLSWAARQEGLAIEIDKIEAPFLRPVAIGQLHLKSVRDDSLGIEMTATAVNVGLNFKHLLLHKRGRIIHQLSIGDLHLRVRRSPANSRVLTQHGWATLQRLLPENASIAISEVRIENGPTLILLRGGVLSASPSEAGRFNAAEVMIVSPWLRQTFSQLRGATHWEGDHLTLGGLTLSRGLDLQSATANLSRLGKQRVGLQFDVDAFGGKIRANISHEWGSPHSNWKIAGSGSDISLAQTSDAFGFADRVDGLLHAANFTFRGNLAEPDRVTASLWTELTSPTWRNRTAEAIMAGAAVYNRKIQLQQLYIRQKTNQFTLSGEAAFPASSSGWLTPDFRGNISASINKLGEFVGLFGANPGDFAGKVTVNGAMDTRDRKFGGRVALEGSSLTLFGAGIDRVAANLELKSNELEIQQLEMKRKNDSLTGQGKIAISDDHTYSGTFEARADNLLDYLSNLPRPTGKNAKPIPTELQATITSNDWDLRGTVRLPESSPISFTADFGLPFGTDWNAILVSPLELTVDFPAVFLAKAPEIFHPGIFRDGILSGSIALSETLQHPRIAGDVQLTNGKLSGEGKAPASLVETSGRIAFEGNRASVEFLNVATNDVDLCLQGEISFEDADDVTVKLNGATAMFDLTSGPMDCVNKLRLTPTVLSLAPAIADLELRGSVFRDDWMVTLQEAATVPSIEGSDPESTTRTFSFCPGDTTDERILLLGAPPRAHSAAETGREKREVKER